MNGEKIKILGYTYVYHSKDVKLPDFQPTINHLKDIKRPKWTLKKKDQFMFNYMHCCLGFSYW